MIEVHLMPDNDIDTEADLDPRTCAVFSPHDHWLVQVLPPDGYTGSEMAAFHNVARCYLAQAVGIGPEARRNAVANYLECFWSSLPLHERWDFGEGKQADLDQQNFATVFEALGAMARAQHGEVGSSFLTVYVKDSRAPPDPQLVIPAVANT